jgi:hypothetical protein
MIQTKRNPPAEGADGLENDAFPGGNCSPSNAPKPESAQAKSELIRAELAERWPAEYADGLAVSLGEMHEFRRDPGDYPKGFHTWPLERRNAWWAGANMGAILFSKLQDGGSDE